MFGYSLPTVREASPSVPSCDMKTVWLLTSELSKKELTSVAYRWLVMMLRITLLCYEREPKGENCFQVLCQNAGSLLANAVHVSSTCDADTGVGQCRAAVLK
ncbi:hypothetical protein DPX16_8613 [Anabarilius grahami]|uniref:Uncharacterized protein n=1 Tax=Anabarilius grahami TaxID=495550 RepID=A0A3N0Z0Z5_ANAGA|nr:hypothetical protein DPX16_8613 [Anabarilius grahami]